MPSNTTRDNTRHRARQRVALTALLTAILAWAGAADAAERWVRGPDDPVTCRGLPGFPNLQSALAGLDPAGSHTVMVSAGYRHNRTGVASPTIRIPEAINGPQGRIQIVGGWRCVANSLVNDQPRSEIRAVGGVGPVFHVDFAHRVELEKLAIVGTTSLAFTTLSGGGGGLMIEGRGRAAHRVTVRDSEITGHVLPEHRGGGIAIAGATIELLGTLLADNVAAQGGGLYAGPFGVDVLLDASPQATRPTAILRNQAVAPTDGHGGGLYLSNGSTPALAHRLQVGTASESGTTAHRIGANSAAGDGGAAWLGTGAVAEIRGRVLVDRNVGRDGGAFSLVATRIVDGTLLRLWADPAGNAPRLEANAATREGGAVACRRVDGEHFNRLRLEQASFVANTAEYRGGAIATRGCGVAAYDLYQRLQFDDNRTTRQRLSNTDYVIGGGAIFSEYAPLVFDAKQGTIRFSRNRVPRDGDDTGADCATIGSPKCQAYIGGGAVYARGDQAVFRSVHFIGNEASWGGALMWNALGSNTRLTIDQSGERCSSTQAPIGEPDECSLFEANVATGADLWPDGGFGQADTAYHGYGAAILALSEFPLGNPTVVIRRTQFRANRANCPVENDHCDRAAGFDGRTVAIMLAAAGGSQLQGNVFLRNGTRGVAGGAPGSLADDPTVLVYPRGTFAFNAMLESCDAPTLIDGRELQVVGNLLYGCNGDLPLMPAAPQAVSVAACNIADSFTDLAANLGDGGAFVENRTLAHDRIDELFRAPAAGDLEPRGEFGIDLCGLRAGTADLSAVFTDYAFDLGGRARPFDHRRLDVLGTWDAGPYEVHGDPAPDALFSNAFE